MEALGYLPEQLLASATEPLVTDLAMPLAVKHDYRDVKISENITVTVDIEELKQKVTDAIYEDLRFKEV